MNFSLPLSFFFVSCSSLLHQVNSSQDQTCFFMLHWFSFKAKMSGEGGNGVLWQQTETLQRNWAYFIKKEEKIWKSIRATRKWDTKRSEEAWGRKEIMLKKVIISTAGFAVAWTTNKAQPVGRCVQQKRLKRERGGSGERKNKRGELLLSSAG